MSTTKFLHFSISKIMLRITWFLSLRRFYWQWRSHNFTDLWILENATLLCQFETLWVCQFSVAMAMLRNEEPSRYLTPSIWGRDVCWLALLAELLLLPESLPIEWQKFHQFTFFLRWVTLVKFHARNASWNVADSKEYTQ